MNLTKEDIKKAYQEFDDMYEEAEISPYNCCWDYFEAGARWAMYCCNHNTTTIPEPIVTTIPNYNRDERRQYYSDKPNNLEGD